MKIIKGTETFMDADDIENVHDVEIYEIESEQGIKNLFDSLEEPECPNA